MQLFIRGLGSRTVVLPEIDPAIATPHSLLLAQAPCAAASLCLVAPGGTQLEHDMPLAVCPRVQDGCTLHVAPRVPGGKPVKVRMLTSHLACGPEVEIDIESDTPMYEVKLQLQAKTGVPVEHQKVLLAGIGQMVMGDKRANVGFTHCGSTNNLYFATLDVGSSSK